MQGEGQEVAWCACRVGAVRTEGRRAGRCTHVARARTRIASVSHFRAGWDGDGGKGGGKGGGGEAEGEEDGDNGEGGEAQRVVNGGGVGGGRWWRRRWWQRHYLCQAEAYPHVRGRRWRLRGGRCGWRRCGGDGETVGDDGGAETAVAMVVAMAAARVAVKAEVEEGGEGGWGCAVVE